MSRKMSLILVALSSILVMTIFILLGTFTFFFKTEGYKTKEISDQTHYDQLIQEVYNSDTMTIIISLSLNPVIEYYEDYLTITYNNPKIDWDNLDLRPPKKTEATK